MCRVIVLSVLVVCLAVAAQNASTVVSADNVGKVRSVTRVAGTNVVRPVVVAREGNGKVTLRYDLPPRTSPRARPAGGGSFDDWNQTAEINSSTGALEISGTNPNGNGSVRRNGQCTVGRLSWNGNQYGWRIPNNSSSVDYYNIDLTGYESGDGVDVYAVVCARGGNAGPWIMINGSGNTFTNVGTTWEVRSITRSGGTLEWNSADNWAEVTRTTSSTDTLGVGAIIVYINGAVPIPPPPGPFNLTSPDNGVTGQLLSGTLRWGTSSNAENYDVYLDTEDPPMNWVGNVTGRTWQYDGLSYSTTYYWDIEANNGSGSTPSSNGPFHFTTIVEPPGPFDLSTPTNGATNQQASGALSWGTSSRATSYDVYWGTSNPPSFLCNVTSTSTSYSGSPGQTYYWYVVAKNAGGTTQCNDQFSFSTLPTPGSFNLTSPANGDTNQPASGTLSWQTSSQATSYDAYWGTSNPPSFLRNVTSTSTSYSGSPGQTYYWYVVAKNNAGNTQCNNQFSFSTLAIPGTFDLSTPPDNAVKQDTSGTLTWKISSRAASYDVYWGTSNPPPLKGNVTDTLTSYVGHLAQTYYWYVAAKNAAGSKECNGRFSFTTTASAVREEASSTVGRYTFGLDGALPNPFRWNTSIRYALPRDGSVKLRILNSSGAVVRTLRDGLGQKGLHRATWDGTDDRGVRVGKGVYFCSLEAGEDRSLKKVVRLE